MTSTKKHQCHYRKCKTFPCLQHHRSFGNAKGGSSNSTVVWAVSKKKQPGFVKEVVNEVHEKKKKKTYGFHIKGSGILFGTVVLDKLFGTNRKDCLHF
jgi:hypothetical protein